MILFILLYFKAAWNVWPAIGDRLLGQVKCLALWGKSFHRRLLPLLVTSSNAGNFGIYHVGFQLCAYNWTLAYFLFLLSTPLCNSMIRHYTKSSEATYSE